MKFRQIINLNTSDMLIEYIYIFFTESIENVLISLYLSKIELKYKYKHIQVNHQKSFFYSSNYINVIQFTFISLIINKDNL